MVFKIDSMNSSGKPLDTKKLKFSQVNLRILKERCKGCGFCVEFCPKKCLELSSDFNNKGYHPPYVKHPQDCIGCNLCGLICPDFAIYCDRKRTKS